jgi:hypothetical protein
MQLIFFEYFEAKLSQYKTIVWENAYFIGFPSTWPFIPFPSRTDDPGQIPHDIPHKSKYANHSDERYGQPESQKADFHRMYVLHHEYDHQQKKHDKHRDSDLDHNSSWAKPGLFFHLNLSSGMHTIHHVGKTLYRTETACGILPDPIFGSPSAKLSAVQGAGGRMR